MAFRAEKTLTAAIDDCFEMKRLEDVVKGGGRLGDFEGKIEWQRLKLRHWVMNNLVATGS
jgi:hypothetical protein